MGEIAEKVTSNLTKTWGRSISKGKNLVNMSVCICIPNEVWGSGKKLKNSQLGRAGINCVEKVYPKAKFSSAGCWKFKLYERLNVTIR